MCLAWASESSGDLRSSGHLRSPFSAIPSQGELAMELPRVCRSSEIASQYPLTGACCEWWYSERDVYERGEEEDAESDEGEGGLYVDAARSA